MNIEHLNIKQINTHLDAIKYVVDNLNMYSQSNNDQIYQTITINQLPYKPHYKPHSEKNNSSIIKHNDDVDVSLMDLDNKYMHSRGAHI